MKGGFEFAFMSILHFLSKKNLYCKTQSAIAINIFLKIPELRGGGGGCLTPQPPLNPPLNGTNGEDGSNHKRAGP